MIQELDDAGFIMYEKYRNIALTEKGMTYGRFLVWRDEKLTEFLCLVKANLRVNDQVEGIERYITPATMRVILEEFTEPFFFHDNLTTLGFSPG